MATVGHINMWDFDESGGRQLADSVGYSHGELLGKGASRRAGKIGTGIHFTGTVGESALLPNLFLPTQEGTAALWFSLDELKEGNVLISARSPDDRDVHMILGVERTGQLYVSMRQKGSTTPLVVKTLNSVSANRWYQLIFTVTNDTYAFYVDGVKWTLDTPTHAGLWFSEISYEGLEYRLGASVAAGHGGVLRGTIDDFCFYDHGFTETEAKAVHQGNATYIAELSIPRPISPITFSVTPERVAYNSTVEVKWEATGALGCLILGVVDPLYPASATRKYSVTADTVYTLSCWNATGSTERRVASVAVGKFGEGIPPIKEDIAPLQEYLRLPVIEETPFVPTPEPPPPPPPSAPTVVTIVVPGSTPTAPKLELPSGCTAYLTTYMKRGQPNDVADVKRLQTFLNETIGAGLPVTGYFGDLTHKAVQRFQVKYHEQIIQPWIDVGYKASDITNGTGYVYKTTKYQINLMKCATLNTPRPDLLEDVRP